MSGGFHKNTKIEPIRRILGSRYGKLLTIYNYCLFQNFVEGIDFSEVKFFAKRLRGDGYNLSRDEMFEYVALNFLKDVPIDYVEFGVFRGDSIKKWASLNSRPESRFFGFDTFEGLPEDWGPTPKGDLSADGKTPDIADTRVKFVRGLFQETLKTFLRSFDRRNRLAVHFDADIYSATLFALFQIDPFLQPGDILMFDEFSDFNHEFIAFHQYVRATYRTWRFICCRDDLYQAIIEVTS